VWAEGEREREREREREKEREREVRVLGGGHVEQRSSGAVAAAGRRLSANGRAATEE
jgi:hypothetical protein